MRIPEKEREQEEDDPDVRILGAYLAGEISLGKAAELLDLSRFELQERFLRLGVPLRLGPLGGDQGSAVASLRRPRIIYHIILFGGYYHERILLCRRRPPEGRVKENR